MSGYRIARHDPVVRRLYAFMQPCWPDCSSTSRCETSIAASRSIAAICVERLLPQLRSTGALINVEMLARARKLGATVTEVGVHHYPRETGPADRRKPSRDCSRVSRTAGAVA